MKRTIFSKGKGCSMAVSSGPPPCSLCGKKEITSTSGDLFTCSSCLELLGWFRQYFSRVSGMAEEEITLKSTFKEDIGADSLDFVEMGMAVEEKFGIAIPDVQAEKIKTVADAICYLQSQRGEKEL